ncbi:hypothetical protein KSP39_PZI020460 [Platanthera zijinensis]|uniref:RBR-type E3 ubiquitin transferase n=1 Tax=Platanthera zijinensis TaxID=2320716 RepID=A0AAP0B089_9ASPA
MEESVQSGDKDLGNSGVDEEFRSCFGEDEDWKDAQEFSSEGNEEVSLKIPDGNKEEGDFSAFIISEMLQGDADNPGEDVAEPIIFSDALEEIVSECSLMLLEGIDEEHIPECSLGLSDDNDEVVSDCSLRLFEGGEEIASMCSLMLSEVHGDDDDDDDDSECSVRLSEGGDKGTLNFARRSWEGREDDIFDSSPRLCECNEEDVSECSLISSEDDDVVSECSLIFSEDHENDILECPMRLLEDDDVVSECSLIFSEDHENDILECPMRLLEMPDKDDEDDDGVLVRIFSKGVSFLADGDLGSRTSGIGVILEKPQGVPFLQVQKKLDFFVEELVAEHLALMDGLLVALKNDCRNVLAFTDSDKIYRMITKSDTAEDQLLIALQERIQELTDKFESFVLRRAPQSELKSSLQLAREATGAFSDLIECSTCGEDKPHSQMIEMYCSHNLCFDCMFVYVESQVRNSQDPVKCPHERCTFYISNGICRSFLPSSSFESLEGALPEMAAQNLWRFYCPFPDCSMLIRAHHCSPSRQPPLTQSSIYCVECPNCCRFVCTRCQVPWHSSMRCEEYQNLPLEERNRGDITSNQLVQVSSWRRCPQCRQLSELSGGCDRRCTHEFCFSCGAEYRHGTQTCRCETLDENSESSPALSEHETELWRWDCFNLLPGSIDGYTEQEKTQLALIQCFLAGGIGFDSHNPHQSPPRSSDSYLDTFKDLNQLPWLESFISVIGDTYQEDHIY